MGLLHFSKLLFLASCLTIPFIASAALQDQSIYPFYHTLNRSKPSNMPSRITIISAQFLGKPYLLSALGEGPQGLYDQMPLYRFDAFDCETFVDTVLAMALAQNVTQFKQCINDVRYQNGNVSFIHRNHFTCLDWNKNNQKKGFVKDITHTLKNKQQQPVVKYAHTLINKSQWYQHLSINRIQLNHFDIKERSRRLKSLKHEGAKLSTTPSTIPYIPLSALFDKAGQANQYLFNQIPNAAIIEIIRPNWDLTQAIGTHLNVSHLGFAIREKDTLLFRQASSELRHVVDVPLIDYLRHAEKSPTIKGINIQIIQSESCGQ